MKIQLMAPPPHQQTDIKNEPHKDKMSEETYYATIIGLGNDIHYVSSVEVFFQVVQKGSSTAVAKRSFSVTIS